MRFDAKDVLMISIRQLGVSHVHVLLCLVADPVRLWVSKYLFQTITLLFFFFNLMNQSVLIWCSAWISICSQNEHLNCIYENFPVCTMNLLNGGLKKYIHYFVYLQICLFGFAQFWMHCNWGLGLFFFPISRYAVLYMATAQYLFSCLAKYLHSCNFLWCFVALILRTMNNGPNNCFCLWSVFS